MVRRPSKAEVIAKLGAFSEELARVAAANEDAKYWGGPTIRTDLKLSDAEMSQMAVVLKHAVALLKGDEPMNFVVIGGEVVDVNAPQPVFKGAPRVVGKFDTRPQAHDAWKAASWSNVDNAHARYLILTWEEYEAAMATYPDMAG